MNETYTKGGVFESFTSTSCCLQNFSPNKIENLASWMNVVVYGMLKLGGCRGME